MLFSYEEEDIGRFVDFQICIALPLSFLKQSEIFETKQDFCFETEIFKIKQDFILMRDFYNRAGFLLSKQDF